MRGGIRAGSERSIVSTGARSLAGCLALLLLVACSQRGVHGELRATSLGAEPAVLAPNFKTAVYAVDRESVASFYLSDLTTDELLSGNFERGQIIHIEMLWLPRAGATPMDESAANVSVRKVLIIDGQVGVYGGTGFALPSGAPGDDRLSVSLFDATLDLIDASNRFNDALSPALLEGVFTAERDDSLAERIRYAASQKVTNLLGRVRYVDASQCFGPGSPQRGF